MNLYNAIVDCRYYLTGTNNIIGIWTHYTFVNINLFAARIGYRYKARKPTRRNSDYDFFSPSYLLDATSVQPTNKIWEIRYKGAKGRMTHQKKRLYEIVGGKSLMYIFHIRHIRHRRPYYKNQSGRERRDR